MTPNRGCARRAEPALALSDADRRGLRPADDRSLTYVTAGIDVTLRRPAPLFEPVLLRSDPRRADEAEITVQVELLWEDKVRAEATSMWKRWGPRP
jgi:acyl-CoA thioesterase FadM